MAAEESPVLKIAAVAMAAVTVVSPVLPFTVELWLIEPGMYGAHRGAVAIEQE